MKDNTLVEIIRVDNDFEADIIESLLNSENIFIHRVHEGAGNYLRIAMGKSNLGVKIYTKDENAYKAKEIVKLYYNKSLSTEEIINCENEINKVDKESYNKEYDKKYVFLRKLFIIIFAFPVFLWLVSTLIRYIVKG